MNLFTFTRYDGTQISVPFKNIDAICSGVREKTRGVVMTTGGAMLESKESYETLVTRYNDVLSSQTY